jgi:hypothetical protein
MTAEEIYTRAEQEARKEHARLCRLFIAGKLDVCPCGMDMERAAIIAAFEKELSK